MNNIMIICMIAGLLVFGACAKSTPTGDVVQDTQTGSQESSRVQDTDQKTTITTETNEGKQVTEVTTGTGDWCQEGSTWSSTGPQGEYKWVVKGVEGSGKYAGYCHVTYDIDAQGTEGNVDVYYKEDGSGYQVMNINGQTYESAWHK